jgi:hypothetical protein
MNSHFPIRSGMKLAVLGGLVAALGAVAFRAQADVWDKKTVLTVDQPIQVQDTYLEPGTYVFKLLNSSSDRHIVQIYNRDQNHLINTIMAIPNYRLEPTGDSRFTFYETPPGSARAMRAWFYPGDNFGQEFRYPKNLRQIATIAAIAPVVRPPEPPPPPIVTQPAEPETPPAPSPAPVAQNEPPQQEEPVVIAQNTTPAPAPQAAPAPEPAPPGEPKELPKTATPYPLIGLGGLLSLAAWGLLKTKSMT